MERKFVRKSTSITAIQWTGKNENEVKALGFRCYFQDEWMAITDEGDEYLRLNYWLVRENDEERTSICLYSPERFLHFFKEIYPDGDYLGLAKLKLSRG